MSELKEFDITLDVNSCEGYQTFRVKAKDKQGAFDEFKKNGGVIVDNEVEVLSLSTPEVSMFDEVK